MKNIGKRSYDDGCAMAHALDLVGERWALLVIRELMLGPKRFTDLRASLPGISANVLTQRLEELEAVSILKRLKLPPPIATWVYQLTDWGMELEPIVQSFGKWAARSPHLPDGAHMSVNSVVLSFRTMFNSDAAGDFRARLQLNLSGEPFQVTIGDGVIAIMRGEIAQPDATLDGSSDAIAALVYGGRDLDEAVRVGELNVGGDVAKLKRFARLFPLPDPAPMIRQAS
ncbi:MAG TPA: winged helix-turn-helix transcriptional regulator [Dongiaceae bacterium]|nr:winged helix-turn-helix transcriptional regulator [Dongiaceae bacterium]